VYRLTPRAEELFPKAYSFVLGALVRELEEREGPAAVRALLRRVARRVAEEAGSRDGDVGARVEGAATALRRLGADLEVERVPAGWLLRGRGCLLADAVAAHPILCGLVESVVEEMTGAEVEPSCDREGPTPRCGFLVRAAGTGRVRRGSGRGAGARSRGSRRGD
jgi:predicted ArsR family transcriptional regulator